ncbi:MAG TPA: YdeI/OmpD-associated family protein [Allosphingosinicella sp.]
MEPTYFETAADFRAWLEAHHADAAELLVGFHKKSTGLASIDWPQARDQALCFGWIDGLRRSLGPDAYTIRFTPRRKDSLWSRVNIGRFEALQAAGLMTPAGERAFEEGTERTDHYSYENELRSLTPGEEAQFRAHAAAWNDFEGRPPSYRKMALFYVTSAKKPETRARRLAILIEDSAAGRKLAGAEAGRKSHQAASDT